MIREKWQRMIQPGAPSFLLNPEFCAWPAESHNSDDLWGGVFTAPGGSPEQATRTEDGA